MDVQRATDADAAPADGASANGASSALGEDVGASARQHAVLGVPLYAGSVQGASALVVRRAISRDGGYACLTGAHGLTLAHRRPDVRAALTGAWMNFPDGAPAAWRQRAGGCAAARRVAGTELMLSVIALGQDLGLRHFLYGSTPQVLDSLTTNLVAAFPRACVVGTLSPPFRQMSADEEKGLATEIRSTSPHIVWVGLGTPKQDLWMHHNAHHLGGALAMGVGAAFDFIGGTKRRAPGWMRDAGLEWLHRMCCEPRRLAPRYLDTNTRFVVYNLQHAVRGRRRGRLHSGR